jgi:3-amino-4-hydroxybenzoic acid synthase
MTTEPTARASAGKLTWLDVRTAGAAKAAHCAEAIHQRVDAVVADDVADLRPLPPTITRVLMPAGDELPDDVAPADIVIVDEARHGRAEELARRLPGVEFGRWVRVSDADSLDRACRCARTMPWSVLSFTDPTRIPLEIVLAAAADAVGSVITVAVDPDEARVVFGVLERGSDGVMMAPTELGDAARLRAAATDHPGNLPLVELEVVATTRVGMGERACVDTCTYLRPDEGILVGSRSTGLVLCVSETHPLPYMPTRPFRVNAGAVMSYTLAADDRTRYLSELCAGSTVLAVDAKGETRPVTVGRVKIETRPLLSVDLVSADGRAVNLILQDDWHVRVLGPGGAVLNSTALRPGDLVLGLVPTRPRHVGYPIDELCYEQ